ncbi:MAG: SGNH/GDSL hydrolase family protein [Verrucomicrobia bacterium]|nr:SGNH/GDSL hydrolase family protein [Verrucomicrobiota bacterium]
MKSLSILLVALLALFCGQVFAATEPTNAKESAEKKAAADKLLDEQYAAWVAKLPPEQQAWERVLQQCLGGFYLPLHKKDKVAGKSNAWDFVVDDPKLPRVLLIGDSISRGYTLPVRKALDGKVNVHRAPENCGPTANGLKKLDIWLGDGKWNLIHFNFGIHDRATKPTDYEQRLEQIIARLQKTGAKLMWASSTPLPPQGKYGSDDAIVERNAIAARVMKKHNIAIDDLHAHIQPHLSEYQNKDDCHFNSAGYDFLGKKVASEILVALR